MLAWPLFAYVCAATILVFLVNNSRLCFFKSLPIICAILKLLKINTKSTPYCIVLFAVVASELLILSLDLVKNRVGVMSPDMRKGFIGNILVALIDKTIDPKVMKAITKMVEDWVKTKVRAEIRINQTITAISEQTLFSFFIVF